MNQTPKTKSQQIRDEIDVLEAQIKPLRQDINDIYKREAQTVEDRIKLCHRLKYKFKEDELLFAAYTRCECGAGMAYPKNIVMHGAWYCSGILLGKVLPGSAHTAPMEFMFFEVKSEDQPSANGATTRIPKDK
jgi:hypothetical protein